MGRWVGGYYIFFYFRRDDVDARGDAGKSKKQMQLSDRQDSERGLIGESRPELHEIVFAVISK